MKNFRIELEEINGRMSLFIWDSDEDKSPIFVSRSAAPSQWHIARYHLLIAVLKESAMIIKENLRRKK